MIIMGNICAICKNEFEEKLIPMRDTKANVETCVSLYCRECALGLISEIKHKIKKEQRQLDVYEKDLNNFDEGIPINFDDIIRIYRNRRRE